MKKANQPNQELQISQAELDRYEKLDQEWREYGIAAPARRALVDAKLYKVSDLRKISLTDLEQRMHATEHQLLINALTQLTKEHTP